VATNAGALPEIAYDGTTDTATISWADQKDPLHFIPENDRVRFALGQHVPKER
jgi:hypothetical protein